MVSKKKLATVAATSFGVALSSVYFAPELQADIMDITYNGGNATASAPGGSQVFIDIDQVNGSLASDFYQWNDSIGRTMNVPLTLFTTTTFTTTTPGGSTFPTFTSTTLFGGIQSIGLVGLSQTILNASTFGGNGQLGGNATASFPGDFGATGTGSGTAYVGFRTFDGNVGWFTVNFAGAEGSSGTLSYGAGEYGAGGEDVHVGGTIPEPSSLAVLAGMAMGASTIRRRRKSCTATAA